ncbi:MAG TPA: LysR family transcriptional regulator [Desulfovibrio sp.]|jgi:molybdate transport system regulatory protein|uniref:winged helix-turn-helix domain-containing protein n=1 Tax=Desulfovibrio TaxID=872 RepID=UPI000418A7DC|nr:MULTISPECIES: LysR family transcriptional regulator [Desulfovibrio]MDY0305495.1 LysR family transcriptional regulator [Desulfovibrionaceae bacterium]HMM39728.1 LysR family transcriptional regulator [Desulfovibrio sp.]
MSRELPQATLRVHLWFENEGGMLFGLGRVQLLREVARLGSLHKAAQALGMSYRAAWGRIKRTEAALGNPVVAKVAGRKGYALTPLGEQLVSDFSSWHAEVERFALERARIMLSWDTVGFAEGPVES